MCAWVPPKLKISLGFRLVEAKTRWNWKFGRIRCTLTRKEGPHELLLDLTDHLIQALNPVNDRMRICRRNGHWHEEKRRCSGKSSKNSRTGSRKNRWMIFLPTSLNLIWYYYSLNVPYDWTSLIWCIICVKYVPMNIPVSQLPRRTKVLTWGRLESVIVRIYHSCSSRPVCRLLQNGSPL